MIQSMHNARIFHLGSSTTLGIPNQKLALALAHKRVRVLTRVQDGNARPSRIHCALVEAASEVIPIGSNINVMPSIIMPTDTTDVCDANSPLLDTGELRVLNQIFQSYGGRPAFSEKAVTVKAFEENGLVVEAILEKQGKVLVIDGGGSLRRSMVGSIIAQLALDNDWVGIIVNGCVRDVDILKSLDLGIRALGCVPVRSSKTRGGRKNVPVTIAGAFIRDGDWVCADNSGILVSTRPLSVLGPLYRPIMVGTDNKENDIHNSNNNNNNNNNNNGSTIIEGGAEILYYSHTIADYTSPVEPHRLFKALCVDDHNFLPKFLPQYFHSIELVHGHSTAVGCIKLVNFAQGNPFKFTKNRVDEFDADRLSIKYTTIEGDILGEKWENIAYEIKIEPSITGSHFKMIGHYHARKGAKPTEEDVMFGQEWLKNMHKFTQENLLFYTHIYP